MEIVNTLDINGTQWEMQDAEARNKIIELEKNLIAQILDDINITLNEGYTSTLAVLRSHYKIGNIHFAIVQINDIKGPNIGTSVSANIGRININLVKATSCLLNDYRNNIVSRLTIANDGTISLAESVKLVQGDNACVGELIFAEE